MEARPQVSIIIPTYNRPVLLQRSLASALAQQGARVEVIVVDDGSVPPAAIQDSPQVTLIRTDNGGVSAARNAGLARSRGDYVMFLDSDDWLEPDAVANLLAAATDCDADLAFGYSRYVDDRRQNRFVVEPKSPYQDSLANAVLAEWPIGSFIIKRSIAAPFDASITLWEVLIFQCSSLARGGTATSYKDVVVNISHHDDPLRISNQFNHFETLMTARSIARIKSELATHGLLNDERIVALDRWLLALLMDLIRERRSEKREIYNMLTRSHIKRQDSHHFASFTWFTYWMGMRGADIFVAANKVMRR